LKEARALNGLGLAVRALGDYAQGRQIHERALALGQELGDSELQWVQQVNLGNIVYELGDFDTAVSRYEAAIHIIRQINDPYALALTILNLGEVRLEHGDLVHARQHYDEALALNQERGYQRGIALAQHGLGLTWLEEKNIHEAQKALMAAQSIWQALNQPLKLMETEAALALVYLAEGQPIEAKKHCQMALDCLDDSLQQTASWRKVHYTAYQVFADMPEKSWHHLQQAGTAVQTLAQSLPPERRQPFLEKAPLNRQIITAVAQHSQHIQVHLVRADVPLGRKLTSDDTIEITWTIHSPLDETIASPSHHRRAILKRLLAEAALQGAAPTDSDLAEALNVSRRTIERDMAALKNEEDLPPTRRRQ
jgi:tetratricopeptide (TPR) repeat protein